MNAADLARLELAKRAYRATEPNATEVQRGVRRARLGLQRPKERRRWFSKGLVMVVLAVGGLAYAKPQAMGELVSSVLEASGARGQQSGRGHGAVAALPSGVPPAAPPGAASPAVSPVAAPAAIDDAPAATAPSAARPPSAAKLKAAPRVAPSPLAPVARPEQESPSGADSASSAAADPRNVSDWGRVGQALARGDENKALAVLSKLSESDDQRTRDKADIGRAQLFMASGNADAACAIARSLTNRRAGSRIERQAQALLKSCAH
jgi:hypothetical protein